jgi:hypothetical protein
VAQTSSFLPTGIFYSRRPIVLPNFANNSGLEQETMDRSPLFPTGKSFHLDWLLNRKQRVFVVIRWRRKNFTVPPGVFTWARNNDFKVISNQPPPPNFRYDFTAPKKAVLDTKLLYGPPPQP